MGMGQDELKNLDCAFVRPCRYDVMMAWKVLAPTSSAPIWDKIRPQAHWLRSESHPGHIVGLPNDEAIDRHRGMAKHLRHNATISEVPFDRDPRKRANVAEGSSFTTLAHGAQHLIFADQEVTCMTESASERSRVKKAIAS